MMMLLTMMGQMMMTITLKHGGGVLANNAGLRASTWRSTWRARPLRLVDGLADLARRRRRQVCVLGRGDLRPLRR